VTERFPEQRDRRSELPVGAAVGDDPDNVVLDESFVRSAPMREASARTRMLEARWRAEPPKPQPFRADADPPPPKLWSVRPSHHLRSMRLSAVFWIAAAVTGTVLLLTLLP
jgi:hypothetical protein